MRAFDFSPMLRSSIGFDHFDRLFDTAQRSTQNASSYPPYNIEKVDENSYRLTMAVAGFSQDDLDVTVNDGVLYISGKAKETDEKVEYLHRGIAGRAFSRRFELAEHIEVAAASTENGLLVLDLNREVPEALKPRKIEIVGGQKAIDQAA